MTNTPPEAPKEGCTCGAPIDVCRGGGRWFCTKSECQLPWLKPPSDPGYTKLATKAEAPKPDRVVHISVGDGAYMELPLKDWLWRLRYNRKEPERGTKCDDRMLSATVMESYLHLLNCTKEEAWRRIKILRAAIQ